jgi:hypothetical protein
MRRAAFALAAIALAGVAATVVAGVVDRREVAFTVGLPAVRIAGTLHPGDERCRDMIEVPARFARVRMPIATFGRPGSRFAIIVRDTRTRRVLGRGDVPAGYPDNSTVDAAVGEIAAGARIAVCVRNAGPGPIAVLGSPPATLAGEVDEQGQSVIELGFSFLRSEPASVIGETATIVERASLFKPGWAGPWLFWLLLAAVAAGVPLLLVAAVRAAYASERS